MKPRDGKFTLVIDAFIDFFEKEDRLSPKTQENWKRELLLAQESLGHISIEVIRPALIQSFLDQLAKWPGKQRIAQAALRALESWAVVRDHLPYPIMTGTAVSGELGGYEPWTDAQVEIAERWASPLMSRAISLAANTGQRGSDLVRMGWSDMETYRGRPGLRVTQQKTGRKLWVPITQELQSILDTWEKRPGPFLLKERRSDLPNLTRSSLSRRWNHERDHRTGLEPLAGLALHGLRATAVVRLRRVGAELPQIADCIGMSEKMVRHYCRLSDQQENAFAAVLHLDRVREQRVTSDLREK